MAGSRCTVCDHPDRKAIEVAIPVSSLRNIEKQWGVSYQAVNRHKRRHLQPAVVRAIARREELGAEALLEKLRGYIEAAEDGIQLAKKNNDLTGLARCIKEAHAVTLSLGKTIGLWSDKPATFIDKRRQTLNLSALSIEELRNLAKLASGDIPSALLDS